MIQHTAHTGETFAIVDLANYTGMSTLDRAEGMTGMMDDVQHFYADGLGVRRIAPYPFPRDDLEDDRAFRLDLINKAANAPEEWRLLGAYPAIETSSGLVIPPKARMVGMAILRIHTLANGDYANEILEIDAFGAPKEQSQPNVILPEQESKQALVLSKHKRSLGLGTAMVKALIPYMRPGIVFADIMEPNTAAHPFYTRLSFAEDRNADPIEPNEDSVFDANHIRWATTLEKLLEALGLTPPPN